MVAFVGFHAYINEIHGSTIKIHSKKFVRQRCAEGFNSVVKGLRSDIQQKRNEYVTLYYL
jgi:hypothetical protein